MVGEFGKLQDRLPVEQQLLHIDLGCDPAEPGKDRIDLVHVDQSVLSHVGGNVHLRRDTGPESAYLDPFQEKGAVLLNQIILVPGDMLKGVGQRDGYLVSGADGAGKGRLSRTLA